MTSLGIIFLNQNQSLAIEKIRFYETADDPICQERMRKFIETLSIFARIEKERKFTRLNLIDFKFFQIFKIKL